MALERLNHVENHQFNALKLMMGSEQTVFLVFVVSGLHAVYSGHT